MKLLKLKLTNFRRFVGDHSLDLNENLIALVGPNEAGKSSILRALELVGRREGPSQSDVSRAAGRDATASIGALFSLDPEDRDVIKDIRGGPEVNRIWVTRYSDRENASWGIEEYPRRDLAPRQKCGATLSRLESDPALDIQYSPDEGAQWDGEAFSQAQAALASEADELDERQLAVLEDVVRRLRSIEYPLVEGEEEPHLSEEAMLLNEARSAAADELAALVVKERQPRPWLQVVNSLESHLPEVALFGDPDRGLESSYRLEDIAADPVPALNNLCALAGVDLQTVQSEYAVANTPAIQAIFDEANLRLREVFTEAWQQSSVYPVLGTPSDGVLRVMFSTEDGIGRTHQHERSEGMRWFMALQAFLVARGQRNPILLVDEAETHLHYDAQADLIATLMSQNLARQVIYTTHSVGCLPPDLGAGIRVALAEDSGERSRLFNSYWSVDTEGEEKAGYSPLLFAMGAQLLALTIPRFGVVVEGPSDAILLPSLFRMAAGVANLPYRIVPGLAELAQESAPRIEHLAGVVAALGDGDDAGKDKQKMLAEAGFPAERSFTLAAVKDGCTLEDLVDSKVLADAMNAELKQWSIGPFQVNASELPPTRRWRWLEEQGIATGTPIERLSKSRVAQRVVDIGLGRDGDLRPIVADDARGPLGSLHEALSEALSVPV